MRTYPFELQALPQWVCWRLELRKGKATKIPINPHTGAKASTTEPATWGAFDAALARMQRDGYPGVGFVFAVSDRLFRHRSRSCMMRPRGVASWAQDIMLSR